MPRLLPVLGLGAVIVSSALAAAPPALKVMSDSPMDKGAWRMEAVEMGGRKPGEMGAMGGMTVCTTAAKAMAREPADTKTQCNQKVLEDTASRAVVDMQCTGANPSSMRMTITRAAPKTYEIVNEMTERGKTDRMRMKISYVGPCSEKDAVVSSPAITEACKGAAAQKAAIDPQQACKGMSGEQRNQCVQMMAQARAQIDQMCK